MRYHTIHVWSFSTIAREPMGTTVFTQEFIDARIAAITAIIIAYETAITALSSGTIKSYTLNTGQTTETVSKKDVVRLQSGLEGLISQLQFWNNMNCPYPQIFRSYS